MLPTLKQRVDGRCSVTETEEEDGDRSNISCRTMHRYLTCPHPPPLMSSSLSFCVPPKLPKLQSSMSLFSLPRIDSEPGSEERLFASANIGVETRPKSGSANKTTSLAMEGLSSRSRSRPLATYWTSYV